MEPSCPLEFDGMCVFVRLNHQSMEKKKQIKFSVVEIRPRLSLNQDITFVVAGVNIIIFRIQNNSVKLASWK